MSLNGRLRASATAYIRASSNAQDPKNQRHEILEYGHREGIQVDTFIEITISSKRRICV